MHHILLSELRRGVQATPNASSLTAPASRSLLSLALHRAVLRLDERLAASSPPDAPDGSTLLVVLSVADWLVVAHIGDSPAFLCTAASEAPPPPEGYPDGTSTGNPVRAEPLTRDHQPHRAEERRRIKAAGGTVQRVGGRWRVQGELLVSRALGAKPYRPFGT
eukprot:6345390-Pyramimonas_sp.AAC.1